MKSADKKMLTAERSLGQGIQEGGKAERVNGARKCSTLSRLQSPFTPLLCSKEKMEARLSDLNHVPG